MAKPTPEGHRPTRPCVGCPDCRTDSLPDEVQPWWVTCGGAHSLIWSRCELGARLELWRIMRLKTVGNGWGTTVREPDYYDRDDRYSPARWRRPDRDILTDRLDNAGITARPATDEDRERWAALVRQHQGLEALEAD